MRFTYETRQLFVSLIERINFQDEIYTAVYTSSFSAVTFNPRLFTPVFIHAAFGVLLCVGRRGTTL